MKLCGRWTRTKRQRLIAERRWTRTRSQRLILERMCSRLSRGTRRNHPFPLDAGLLSATTVRRWSRSFPGVPGSHDLYHRTPSYRRGIRAGQQKGSESTNNNSRDAANKNSSSRWRRRAARPRKTGRTRIGRILKCRFAGGRRFRPTRSRSIGRGFWARGRRRKGDELLVMDDDSVRIFEMMLAFLRGGANPGDQQQVCIVPALFILFLISPPSFSCVSCGVQLIF